MKVAVIFDNFGPYHLARLRATACRSDMLALQVRAQSKEYVWAPTLETSGFRTQTLLETAGDKEANQLPSRLNEALTGFRPGVVFVPGWSSPAALSALNWCGRNRVPAVAMSESTAWDAIRNTWREAVKRRIIRYCSAALVGGVPHADYVAALGLPPERVFLGYDAVDNHYFIDKAAEVRKQSSEVRSKHGLPEHYFLASARFIEKKNLPRLLQAYARYRDLCAKSKGESACRTPPG